MRYNSEQVRQYTGSQQITKTSQKKPLDILNGDFCDSEVSFNGCLWKPSSLIICAICVK